MEKLKSNDTQGARDFLAQVEELAHAGYRKVDIAERFGLKTIFTLNNRLVKASQISGKPVPELRTGRRGRKPKRVEEVEIRRRGKGGAFGLNIPQEPLERAGIQPGDRLRVRVMGKRLTLTRVGAAEDQQEQQEASEAQQPRVVKKGKRRQG